MVIEWMDDIKGGKYFSVILEALYQTMLTKKKLEKMVSDSHAKMDEFALVIQAVNGLKNGYGSQVNLAEKLLKGLKFIGGLSAAVLPQSKLILAAADIALGGYVVLVGADYVDSPKIKWLDRMPGVSRIIEANLVG